MSKLKSLFIHLRNGPLFHRITHHSLVSKHKKWEAFQKSPATFLEMVTFGDARLRLYKDFGSSRKIFAYEAEKEEVSLVYSFLEKGNVFFDIGAHIGYFTVTAAMKVGNAGQVHSFEPTPSTFQKLEENININPIHNVSANNIGLSDSLGELTLHTHPFNEAHNTIGEIKGEGVESVQIKTMRLDDYAKQNGLIGKIDFIKIDVEVRENHVFKGDSEVLAGDDAPVIMLEFSYDNQKAANSSCEELADILSQHGYRFYLFDSNSRQLVKFELDESYRESYNLFAIKELEKVQNRIG